MSAAEPAPRGPYDGARSASPVIELFPKRRRRRTGQPAAIPPDTVGETSPQQQLAETLEAHFQRAGARTLTDDETAAVFLVALGVFTDLIDGALAQHLLDEEQHRHLRCILDDMKDAPARLA